MKFYGKGVVWNPDTNKPLCRFVKGELETTDKYVIDRLIERGYRHEQVEETLEELREAARAAGIKGFALMKRETLIERLSEDE